MRFREKGVTPISYLETVVPIKIIRHLDHHRTQDVTGRDRTRVCVPMALSQTCCTPRVKSVALVWQHAPPRRRLDHACGCQRSGWHSKCPGHHPYRHHELERLFDGLVASVFLMSTLVAIRPTLPYVSEETVST